MNLDNPLLSLSGFGLLGLSSSCKQKRHLPITKNGFFYPLDCLLLGPLSCTFCQVDCTIFCQPLTPQLNVNKESEWIFRVKSSPKKRVCWFHVIHLLPDLKHEKKSKPVYKTWLQFFPPDLWYSYLTSSMKSNTPWIADWMRHLFWI